MRALARPLVPAVLAAPLLLLGLAACEDAVVVAIDPVLEVTPKHLDFGTVELGQENRLPIQIRNLETVRGVVQSVEITETNCEGCFLPIDPPTTIEGFEKVEMMMRFRAMRLEVATATATIRTDDPKAPLTTVTMIGRGSDMRKPCIEVAPASVDFGFVPAGGIAVQSFVVRSCGTNDLLIDSIVIDPADAPFKVTTSTPSPERPGRLAPGQQASVSLRAALPETLTGTATAKVVIRSNVLEDVNVPGEPGVVHVPLKAKSNLPPLAIVGGDQTVEPWSRVTLDGSASHDQDDPPDDPIAFRWTIISMPEGSTTRLERASTAQPSFWVDLTGRYEVQLVVTDALGLESEPATVVVEALPTNAIRIELTWDHPDSDLDLHLIRDGGAFCDCSSDCHYRDCGRRPDWFPGSPGSNPTLDIDDRSGFGPENINIDGQGPSRLVQPGSYTIAVHYYSSNDGISSWPTSVSNATVRVYILGLLAGELTRAMTDDNEVWFAGRINWPEKTVTPDGNVQPAQICGVF